MNEMPDFQPGPATDSNKEQESAYEHCIAVTKMAAKNFHFSFYTLNREQYRSMCALYAFMRKSDDIADDESRSVEERLEQLQAWQTGLNFAIESGGSHEPELRAVADVAERHMMPIQYLHDVIDGVRMDLNWRPFETFQDLERYCYHVAGAVGLCCISIWGFTDDRALEHAIDCGTAFQLTNILRDLREDEQRDRFYLPQQDLRKFGLTADDIFNDSQHPSVKKFLQFQAKRAENYYRRAAPLVDHLPRNGQRIFRTMMRLYGGIFKQIRNAPEIVLRQRVQLSTIRKSWIAVNSMLRPGQKIPAWMREPASESWDSPRHE